MEFDDILLAPRVGTIDSRDDVSLTSPDFGGYFPIISSPMKGVSGVKLVQGMDLNNCIGILHRFDKPDLRKKNIDKLSKKCKLYGISIGIRKEDEELEIAKYAIEKGADIICIDIANGYIPRLIDFLKSLNETIFESGQKTTVIAGNVATYDGAELLAKNGVKMIRIGIGPGHLCRTRDVTGVGVPQLTAIADCSRVKEAFRDVRIIADGGIRCSGDAVKCFAMGADYVMLGTLLAKTREADNRGEISGMASEKIQVEFSSKVKSIEGVTIHIKEPKKDLDDFLNEFMYGIKSACTYLNSKSHLDLKSNARPIYVRKHDDCRNSLH